MKTTVTVPQNTSEQEVVSFYLTPNNREVVVTIKEGRNTYRKIPIDISTLLSEATATQKTVLKVFFKQLGLVALTRYNQSIGVEVALTDIDGELFTEEEEVTKETK